MFILCLKMRSYIFFSFLLSDLLLPTYFYFISSQEVFNFILFMNLFRRYTLIVLFALICFVSQAKQNEDSIERFFIDMPDEEIEYLDMSLKREMIELYKATSTVKVRNLMGGESWISYIDSSRIDIVLAANKCFMTIKQYKRRNRVVYTIIRTLHTPIVDSYVSIYSNDIESIEVSKYLKYPKFADFFAKTKNKDLKRSMSKISMLFYKIDVLPNGNISISLNDMWLDVLDDKLKQQLTEIRVKHPLYYKWNGKRFKQIEY